uniref:Uncharacterized protein n=1 Tax=Oryza punctata TaxID=4537 RepID=A0A0E0L1K7_ORYPU
MVWPLLLLVEEFHPSFAGDGSPWSHLREERHNPQHNIVADKALLDNINFPENLAVNSTIAQIKAMVEVVAIQHVEMVPTIFPASALSSKCPSRQQLDHHQTSQEGSSYPNTHTSDTRDKIDSNRRLNADLRNVMHERPTQMHSRSSGDFLGAPAIPIGDLDLQQQTPLLLSMATSSSPLSAIPTELPEVNDE